jgi:SAM-dependent methyltransferase
VRDGLSGRLAARARRLVRDPRRHDLICRRGHRLLESLGLRRGWFRELSDYYRGMTMQEFWVRYTLGRMDAATLWDKKPRSAETDYRSFYGETDYFLLRQLHYHRHECYHVVGASMRRAGRTGDLCEYGGGVGPVTAWARPRFPAWRYTIVDLPSPALDFARWRFRRWPSVQTATPGLGADLPLTRSYDVITCLDVLEHVINPLEVVHHLVDHLKPGGTFHVNFIDAPGGENLKESAAERAATLTLLNSALTAIHPLHVDVPDEEYGQYVKRSA